jgi:hypothetical protein
MHLSWRGPPGSGKRHTIHQELYKRAAARGVQLKIVTKLWSLEKPKEDDGGEEDEATTIASKDQIPFETSMIHFGFDVSRMSLQDRHILKPILERLGKGSHVLSGKDQAEKRILVFYHAHLLSTESCVILQSLLEQDGSDISIWCTSEHPLPIRIAHHFKEMGIGGKDYAFEKVKERIVTAGGNPVGLFDPQTLFDEAVRRLSRPARPTIDEVMGIRTFIYECLIRNVRWIECIHHLMISLLRLPLSESHRLAALRILAKQEGSAAGQTIPSYRIPMAWESLFLRIREALSGALSEEDARPRAVHATAPQGVGGHSATSTQGAAVTVDTGATVTGRPTVAKARGGRKKPV